MAWQRPRMTCVLRPMVVAVLLLLLATAPSYAQCDALAALNLQVVQLSQAGRHAEALALGRSALAVAEQQLGSDHANLACPLNALATAYQVQRQYAEAEPLFKRALSITENALGPDHRNVGTTLNNLGLLYAEQGRHIEAEPLYMRSLAVLEKALDPDHPEVGNTLYNLARLYGAQGRSAEAEPLFKRALMINVKVLGPNHVLVASTLFGFAEFHRAQGRYAAAEPLFKRSVAIVERVLGPSHPEVAKILDKLAEVYRAQGRSAAAVIFSKRSLAIRQKAPDLSGSQAKETCHVYSLGPGNDHVTMDGWLFTIIMEEATKPVVIGCRPRAPSVRAADGTSGIVLCDNLQRSSVIAAGKRNPEVFVGDPNFIYEIKLKEPGDSTTIRVCGR